MGKGNRTLWENEIRRARRGRGDHGTGHTFTGETSKNDFSDEERNLLQFLQCDVYLRLHETKGNLRN
jgi:hypothetical protein